MNIKKYKVGGHLFSVHFNDERNDEKLLPSYTPFISEDNDPELFVLTTTPSLPETKDEVEVGQFDCGGANHGIYRLKEGGYAIHISTVDGVPCCRLLVNSDFSVAQACIEGDFSQRTFAINNCLMITYAFSAATKDTLLMHSSVIMYGHRGYLFQGKSGTGKSTHSKLWLKYINGTELLNDDNPVVRISNDNVVTVYGTPWSGKTPCYKNLAVPVGAFLRLHQAPQNEIKRLTNVEAFASILSSCSTMIWDKPTYNGICDTIGRLVGITPGFDLRCLPDEAAAQLSFHHLTK